MSFYFGVRVGRNENWSCRPKPPRLHPEDREAARHVMCRELQLETNMQC